MDPPAFISIWLNVCAEPRLTWKYMPEAWSASELNRVLVLPSIALAGASPAPELVFELAVQPVSLSGVSAAAAAPAALAAPLALAAPAGPASGPSPRKAVSAAAVSPAVSSASRPRRLPVKPELLACLIMSRSHPSRRCARRPAGGRRARSPGFVQGLN